MLKMLSDTVVCFSCSLQVNGKYSHVPWPHIEKEIFVNDCVLLNCSPFDTRRN